MDAYEENHFLATMQEDNRKVIDLADGIYHAMQSVPEYEGPRWFGFIENGVFFATETVWRWYPDIHEKYALFLVTEEFGDGLTEGL